MTRVDAARIAAMVAALGALAAACGGTASADTVSADSFQSPLADLFGWNETDDAEARAMQLAQEEAIARCMRSEGFEYEPVDYAAAMSDPGFEIDPSTDPIAFGEKYGYGVVHAYEQWEMPYLTGGDPDAIDEANVFEDPNAEYVNSLSSNEMNAYYATLYGDQDDTEMVEGETYTPPPLEEQGCMGRAQLEVGGDNPFSDPDLQVHLQDFWEQLEDDPDIEAAAQRWLTCMRDESAELLESDVEGFAVAGPDDTYQLVEFRKNAAMGMRIVDFSRDPGGGTSYSSEGEQSAIGAADLEELRAYEIDLWKHDVSCQSEADMFGARQRAEQRLVDELVAEFPELLKGSATS